MMAEASVHKLCLLYAAQVCPHLSSPNARYGDDMRSGRKRMPKMRGVGFRRTAGVKAHNSLLQPGAWELAFAHDGYIGEFTYERPEELADLYRARTRSRAAHRTPPS